MNKDHKTKSKKSKRRVTAIATAVLLIPAVSGGILLASGATNGFPDGKLATKEDLRLLTVETVAAKVKDSYPIEERFVGRAEAARTSDLGFELAGTVIEINSDEGQRVEEGQVLAKLDTERLEARREELTALLNQAEATLTLAKSTLERFDSAVQLNAVSRQQYDEANENKLRAAAAVSRVKSQIKAIDVDIKKSVIRAPYAGAVTKRSVDEGTIVSPGLPVLRLVEVDRIEVRIGFSIRAASSINIGDTLEVTAAANEEKIPATVTRILPERGKQTRTVDVILTINSPGTANIRPGDLLNIVTSRNVDTQGIWLPRTALTESSRGLWAGYALTETDLRSEAGGQIFQLERRQLEVIDESGENVYVRGALRDGDIMVSSGLQRLIPGQRVQPKPIKSTPPATDRVLGSL